MDDYRFDALGWYQFERLIQGLLKAELGFSVESWGGRGDWGRDAWCETPLPLTRQSQPDPGPFLFQVKFVEHANAAGARPESALKNAVHAEVAKPREKGARRLSPRHYVFITNAPTSPTIRTWISERITKIHPKSIILVWSGKDIGDILHRHPKFCRAYPEILSLRNLDTLLGEVVHRDILNRSADALAFARDLAPAFVTTRTYSQAWEILGKHHFVVLDGPPEMGKTAIARMIGLTQMVNDWEVYECQEPQDIDRVFQRDAHQVFIADDAFGRTEYDPMKGRAWETAIPRLLRRLDGKHWLLWTSRKHILERALSKMDLQSPARNFPNPGEVIVAANNLSLEEKARMLYRHAKAMSLSEAARALVKENAKFIVESPHFTPERIRRLCADKVEQLCTTNPSNADIETTIEEAINNPTESMRKSLLALGEDYRWLLMSLLNSDAGTESALYPVYEAYVGPVLQSNFHRRLEDLDGSFLRIRTPTVPWQSEPWLDWVHPSFRDLIIDYLADDLTTQERYWLHAGAKSVAIALSESGGAQGERRWPLLQHQKSWQWFTACCERLAENDSDATVTHLLNYLSQAWEQDNISADEKSHLSDAIERVLQTLSTRWRNDGAPDSSRIVFVFSELRRRTRIAVPMPDVLYLFENANSDLDAAAEDAMLEDQQQLTEWLRALRLLHRHQRRWFSVSDNIDKLVQGLQSIETAVSGEIEYSPENPADHAEHLRSLSTELSAVQAFLQKNRLPEVSDVIANECEARAEELESEVTESDEEDDESSLPRSTLTMESFNLQRFFADL